MRIVKLLLLNLMLLGMFQSNLSAGTPEQRDFIERFYQNILNRTSDDTGMTTWMNVIQNQSATQVAMGFLNSPELTNKNLSNEEFIDIMYQTMFGRLADSGGRNDWLEKMRNGRTKQSVMFGFFQSQEFKNLTDSFGVIQILPTDRPSLTGVESYVDRFYKLVLKRDYDENGFNDWVSQLTNQTKNSTEIASGFLFSPEYINQNENNSTFLDTCYKAFFGREADNGGKSDWLNKINQGYTRQQIFEGFTGSQEFKNLVDSFDLDKHSDDSGLRPALAITSPSYFSIDENSLETISTTASLDGVTFELDGVDKFDFSINPTTGQISFNDAPDFERKNFYQITVIAKKDSLGSIIRAEKDLTININDLYEGVIDTTPPEFINSSLGIREGSLTNDIAMNIVVTDENPVTYSIKGVDAEYLSIDSKTGKLTFKVAPDYETKNIYRITAEAVDSFGNKATKDYEITINDYIDENADTTPPVITSANTFSVKENQGFMGNVSATDNKGNENIDFRIEGIDGLEENGESSKFEIINGEVYLKHNRTGRTFDYETKPQYNVTLVASDNTGNKTEQNITINVINTVDENESITHKDLTYKTVKSPNTGRIWLDRNLGATAECSSIDDANCFGDYYQFGRLADGHEKLSSLATTQKEAGINETSNNFVINQLDWTIADESGLERKNRWASIDGEVCPVGFRIAKVNEWESEYSAINFGTWTENTRLFNNFFLKIPSAGTRNEEGIKTTNSTNLWTIWDEKNAESSAMLISMDIGTSILNKSKIMATPIRCILD